MARIRSIKPEFFLHEGLAALSAAHRLLFIGLWTLADKEGRLEDRPRRIKAALFPWDDLDIDAMLDVLQWASLLVRYSVDGVDCIAIPTFAKHQRPHPKEAKSELPAPSADVLAAASREVSRRAVERSSSIPSSPAGKEILESGKEISVPLENGGREKPRPQKPPVINAVGSISDGAAEVFRRVRGAEYALTPRDEVAVGQLQKYAKGDDDLILRCFENGLRRTSFPRVNTLHDLVQHWNACSAPEPSKPSAQTEAASVGRRAEPESAGLCERDGCDLPGKYGWWGKHYCAEHHVEAQAAGVPEVVAS